MKKALMLLMTVLMVSTLSLTGCGGNQQDVGSTTEKESDNKVTSTEETKANLEQILKINLGSNPPNIDPQTTTDDPSMIIINSTLEGLVRIKEGGVIEQGSGLAESWEISEDGKTYVFKLRDANWSDGTPITSSDFEYAWKRALKPETASQYSYVLYYIKGAEAYNKGEGLEEDVKITSIDEKTLEVELERPTPYFLSLTAFATYMPAQKLAVETFGDSYGAKPENTVSSGPFLLDTWAQEQKIVMVKNQNYWDAESVKLDRIECDLIVDINTPINLFETNELDMIGIPTEYLSKYRTSPEFINLARASSWYFQFNCENEFFSNEKIRKAFSLAVNRKAFVDNILANGSIVASGLVPSGIPGAENVDGDFRVQSGNYIKDQGTDGELAVKEAKILLEEGLNEIGRSKAELEEEIVYLAEDGDLPKKLAQAFQQMWKKNLELDVAIETVTFKLKLDKEQRGDFMFCFAGWNADYNDPMTYMDMWVTDGGQNRTGWSNVEYDKLIEKANNSIGNERMEAMIEAEAILMEEMPIAPVYYRARNIMQREYLKGLVRFPVGIPTEYKWGYISEH